ncbi:hypothetical protein FXW30_00495 [Candidatus Liberibacter asiaticus]|nr:hypothetical protein FXW22_00495 [Candidatus Liberibacter asiaticus]KAE9511678.1 hypothetical protein FXW31_00345 [Candidatus Liberibacter asiaticus]KAE9512687.1 hypothetical protein FXW32_00325 [Candidatus Liberibacter asiaticus]KAE9513772.1 hypothetical protein FXW35_00550 [Candidatus Liberibacter asiaticus]KAE9514825.1 hypothetical protein FXW25_00480 [Candidatus Liberibacter asiaticus]
MHFEDCCYYLSDVKVALLFFLVQNESQKDEQDLSYFLKTFAPYAAIYQKTKVYLYQTLYRHGYPQT